MDQQFIDRLYHLHASTPRVPSSEAVCTWLDGLLGLLFPELATQRFANQRAFAHQFQQSRQELHTILEILEESLEISATATESAFMAALPAVHHRLEADAQAIL